jgi:hypothetical protein
MRTNDVKEVDLVKDCVGFNLLLAIVIQNVTRAHLRLEELLSGESSDEIITSGQTTNTIFDDMRTLVGLCETNFN